MDRYGINYQLIRADVSSPTAIEGLYQLALTKFGHIDIVINKVDSMIDIVYLVIMLPIVLGRFSIALALVQDLSSGKRADRR